MKVMGLDRSEELSLYLMRCSDNRPFLFEPFAGQATCFYLHMRGSKEKSKYRHGFRLTSQGLCNIFLQEDE